MYQRSFLLALVLFGSTSHTCAADAKPAPNLTIYSANLALIQEQRDISLHKGKQWLNIDQVSDQLIPESVRLQLPHGASVIQQSFHHDPISLRRLLELSVGKDIEISRLNPASGNTERRPVRLIALEADRVTVHDAGKISSLPIRGHWDYLFPTLPEQLTARPQLRSLVDSNTSTTGNVGVRYLSSGLDWQANYDLNLARDGNTADLTCWVSLSNHTRNHWSDAHIDVVAGELNRASPVLQKRESRQLMMMADSRAGAPSPSRSVLGDYHLYRIQTPLSLNPGEQKQVRLFSQNAIPVSKHYRFDFTAGGGLYQRLYSSNTDFSAASVTLRLNDKKQAKQPFPAGLWRVFSTQEAQHVRLLGEDRAPHTPVDRPLSLQLGKAFDVSGKRTQSRFQRVDKKETLSDWKVVLRNAGDQNINIEVNDRLGVNWSIVEESHRHKRKDAQQAEWHISVPAHGETTLSYRVRVRQR